MDSIKFFLLNVHMWKSADSKYANTGDVFNIVSDLQPDIIGLNEVYHFPPNYEPITIIGNKLHRKAIFAPAGGDGFGNALLIPSKDKIIQTNRHVLVEHTGAKIHRSVLHIELDKESYSLDDSIHLYLLHLDHQHEETRIKELKSGMEFIKSKKGKYNIIMGDFNSICPYDYSEEYFNQQIRDVRISERWEGPKFDIYNYLSEVCGYTDCFLKLNNNEKKDKDLATCDWGTRIDYYWVSNELQQCIDWSNSTCSILSHIKCSDHSPVTLILKFKLKETN